MKVGFQGTIGSYSNQALIKKFGKNIDYTGFVTFEDVFRQLREKNIDLAFLPVENSIAGSVAPVYDLMLKEDVYAIEEFYMFIDHVLLGIKGSCIEDIKKVYSHPVALEQCRDFIHNNSFKAIQKYDTSGAAEIVSQKMDKNIAAIASSICSEIYDLDILARNISSYPQNYTRFMIIKNKSDIDTKEIDGEKTSMVFKPKHTVVSGSLSKCLDIFAKYNINLTKVESRPDPKNLWEYVFYIDIDSSVNNKDFKKCLLILEDFTDFYKILGNYQKYSIKK